MQLNDLFDRQGIDPKGVLVFRHRPKELELNKVLPWLAADRPEVFNAYQQTQGEKVERVMQAMVGSGYVASFIRRVAGTALFVGLYKIASSHALERQAFEEMSAHRELAKFGFCGWNSTRSSVEWFDLVPVDFYTHWKGKLVVDLPPPERSWWRRAHRNAMPVHAVLAESELATAMPEWHDLTFTWEELSVLPSSWNAALAQWRGIYYIVDVSDGTGYVGSAYGSDNLLGRWRNYAQKGDGGNRLLRGRNPRSFRFSILERVSPDLEQRDVIQREASWKSRLHTREPFGLNAN